MQENTVMIYAAGGTGINAISPLVESSVDTEGYAKLFFSLIDTSHSNIDKENDILMKHFYFIKNSEVELTDGSGKDRRTNVEAIRRAIPYIINTFQPKDLNIVVQALGGGSGSTIGPLLANELLSKGHNVIMILVDSQTSIRELKNSIDVLHGYQALAEKREVPVVSYHLSNTDRSPEENNDLIRLVILYLSALWSGENHGLDRKDLDNFINYHRVTQFPVGLVCLQIETDGSVVPEPEKGQPISTVVTLINEGGNPDPGFIAPYHAYGELPARALEKVKTQTPIHFYTVQGYFAARIHEMEKAKTEAEEGYRINPVASIKLDKIKSADDGLIL